MESITKKNEWLMRKYTYTWTSNEQCNNKMPRHFFRIYNPLISCKRINKNKVSDKNCIAIGPGKFGQF